MRKIIVYGGSFDPVHKGHLHAIRKAWQAVGADLLIVVPAYVSPLKARELSAPKHRVAMLRLAMRSIPEIKYEICDYELKKKGVSYTYETLCWLKKRHEKNQLHLVIGSDQLNQFDLWKNAHLFKELCEVISVRRTTYISRKNIKRFQIRLLDNKLVETSSTELRSRVDASTTVRAVNRYINENLLYLDERVKKWQTEKRWAHTVSVAECVAKIARSNKLSKRTQRKAVIAAYFHDLAKDFQPADLISYAKRYLPGAAEEDPELLHAHVGADYVARFYGMEDRQIISAIANHTLPLAKKLTAVDRLLYVADKVEPLRNYPSRKKRYALALKDYRKAFAVVYCEQYERFNRKRAESAGPAHNLYVRLKGVA